MLPKKHIGINGVKISTVSIHPAVIDVKVETSASGELELEIFEGESLVSGQEPVASVKKSADGNCGVLSFRFYTHAGCGLKKMKQRKYSESVRLSGAQRTDF